MSTCLANGPVTQISDASIVLPPPLSSGSSLNTSMALVVNWPGNSNTSSRDPRVTLDPRVEVLSQTHRNTLLLVTDAGVVLLPGDGRFWVPSWWDALHHSWLSRCHHDITGSLPEVVSQDCKKGRRAWAAAQRGQQEWSGGFGGTQSNAFNFSSSAAAGYSLVNLHCTWAHTVQAGAEYK